MFIQYFSNTNEIYYYSYFAKYFGSKQGLNQASPPFHRLRKRREIPNGRSSSASATATTAIPSSFLVPLAALAHSDRNP